MQAVPYCHTPEQAWINVVISAQLDPSPTNDIISPECREKEADRDLTHPATNRSTHKHVSVLTKAGYNRLKKENKVLC
jgi:hypothetical protein